MLTRLFTVTDSDKAQLEKNVNAVCSFASRYPGRVTFLLAPSASVIYPEMLPDNAPMVDEDAMLDEIFARVGEYADVMDLRPLYRIAKDQDLYFNPAPHWTPTGAAPLRWRIFMVPTIPPPGDGTQGRTALNTLICPIP